MMTLNISNSPVKQEIHFVLNGISSIITYVLLFISASLCIQSFMWSIYILNRLIHERKLLKYIKGSKSFIHEQVWLTKIKNSNRKIVKNKCLFLICSIEWIYNFVILFSVIYNNMKFVTKNSNTQIYIDISNTLFQICNGNFLSKLIANFFLTMFLLLLIAIRILTQYLCVEYSYYPDTLFKFSTVFKYNAVVLILIFLLGLIRITIWIQWVLICICMIYEFVCYTKATRMLCNLLYKRYFDAKIHEYQPKHVVQYYRLAYLEFKFGSCILVTSFSLQIISLILLITFSLLRMFLSSPNNRIQVLLNVIVDSTSSSQLYQQRITILKDVFNVMELLCTCVAFFLLIVPYSLVSLKFCLFGVKARVAKSQDYPNHELIRKMIYNNNLYYNRR